MEEVPFQYVANPLISWGVLISCLASFKENFKEAPPRLNLSKLSIGVNFPYNVTKPSGIVVGLNSLEVQNMGFYSAELTEPRNQLLKSTGEIGFDLYSANHSQLMTMVDYITQCYPLNLFDKQKMAYPGAERAYVAIGYGHGTLNWSKFAFTNPPHTDEKYERMFTTSTSFKFFAEHHVSTELARVSAIDMEAVPLNFVT